jgi:hypothetical protein
MTAKIAFIAAIVLNVGFGIGFGQFIPGFAKAGTTAAAEPAETLDITHMSASRKVRCIMPPALRTACEI